MISAIINYHNNYLVLESYSLIRVGSKLFLNSYCNKYDLLFIYMFIVIQAISSDLRNFAEILCFFSIARRFVLALPGHPFKVFLSYTVY